MNSDCAPILFSYNTHHRAQQHRAEHRAQSRSPLRTHINISLSFNSVPTIFSSRWPRIKCVCVRVCAVRMCVCLDKMNM